jgi:hypothetical protein
MGELEKEEKSCGSKRLDRFAQASLSVYTCMPFGGLAHAQYMCLSFLCVIN